MDTEEHIEIQKATREGRPHTDEGPYYHEAWWESYKGAVKGKLGGAVIGATVGGLVGVAAALIAMPFVGTGGFAMMVGGFSAAGLLYAVHEFSNIGKVVGAGAAIAEKQEERTNSRFRVLEKKLDDLKAMLSGKRDVAADAESSVEPDISDDYRTSHCVDQPVGGERKWMFWKVAGIGLTVGLAAGALLTFGGATEHLMDGIFKFSEPLSKAAHYALSMTSLGLFGASFGINRDMFRHIFDKTDLLFRGIVLSGKSHQPALNQDIDKSKENTRSSTVTTIVYENMADYPISETFHRDKLATAKLALLSMDHTKSLPN